MKLVMSLKVKETSCKNAYSLLSEFTISLWNLPILKCILLYERDTVKSGVLGLHNFVTVYCGAKIVNRPVEFKGNLNFIKGISMT